MYEQCRANCFSRLLIAHNTKIRHEKISPGSDLSDVSVADRDPRIGWSFWNSFTEVPSNEHAQIEDILKNQYSLGMNYALDLNAAYNGLTSEEE